MKHALRKMNINISFLVTLPLIVISVDLDSRFNQIGSTKFEELFRWKQMYYDGIQTTEGIKRLMHTQNDDLANLQELVSDSQLKMVQSSRQIPNLCHTIMSQSVLNIGGESCLLPFHVEKPVYHRPLTTWMLLCQSTT